MFNHSSLVKSSVNLKRYVEIYKNSKQRKLRQYTSEYNFFEDIVHCRTSKTKHAYPVFQTRIDIE